MLNGENGIISQAQNAKKKNEIEDVKEQAKLDIMTWRTNELASGNKGTLNDATVKNIIEKANENINAKYYKELTATSIITKNGYEISYSELYSSIPITGGETVVAGKIVKITAKGNYTDGEGNKATIPSGYTISNIPGEQTISTGLVIYEIPEDEVDDINWEAEEDGTYEVRNLYNQFVWVPVPDVTTMYGTLSDGTLTGKFYNFTSTNSSALNWEEDEQNVMTITSEIKEPGLVSNYDSNESYLNIIKEVLTDEQSQIDYANVMAFETTMKKDFEEMITSVQKYDGFYIARYEMSLSGEDKAQFIKNKTSLNSSKQISDTEYYRWYGLYAKAKEYSTSSTQGSMIWGSQYDAMMQWMQQHEIDVTSSSPIVDKNTNEMAIYNSSRVTGSEEKDKLLNIYDLLGNSREWTLEARSDYHRVARGGHYDDLEDSPIPVQRRKYMS